MSVSEPLPPAAREGKAKTFAIVTVIVALIAGVMIGVVVDRTWMWRHRGRMADRAMRAVTARILARFDSELGLTPSQHAAIGLILERHRKKVSAVFAQIDPEIQREIDSANSEIKAELGPEQQSKFEKVKLRMRRPGGRPPAP